MEVVAILEATGITKTIDTGTHRVEILRGVVHGVAAEAATAHNDNIQRRAYRFQTARGG